MNVFSIPCVVMAAVNFFVAMIAINVYARRGKASRDFMVFAPVCFAVCCYDITSAGIYNAGSFAAGFLAIWLEERGPAALYWRAFLMVGILGALTTYSALMVECLLFAKSSRGDWALGYLAVTLAAGLGLVWLGARTAAALRLS